MSGGTPTAGGLMRQRHSQGYASSGDDLEDDACSRIRPKFPETRTWTEVLENVLWFVSASLIIYLGDWHSNLIYILFHDARIRSFCFALWPIWSFLTLPLVFFAVHIIYGMHGHTPIHGSRDIQAATIRHVSYRLKPFVNIHIVLSILHAIKGLFVFFSLLSGNYSFSL
ncbi:uncharacterized protein LOC110928634 isoform X3 [Helianthus annuus]|uniref:uncharacterized protein LOC110928634 isoform X3 n=1 Tax=Helianthus annuus TaxID=4232 RepID=UPI000B8F31D3|nr:uncharacterized protein LOC110928634 isoform X3 [Helianthus annuus]